MIIVDSNIHTWSQGTPLHFHRQAPYPPAQALADMDEAGIKAAVILPPAWDLGSVDAALAAAAAHPARFGVFHLLPLAEMEDPAALRIWIDSRPGMLGLRILLFRPDHAAALREGRLDRLFAEAERASIPIAMFAADHLADVEHIAARHPKLRLLIDHMAALTGKKDGEAFANLGALTGLGRFANVGVKISAGPAYVSDAYPFRSLTPVYQRIHDAFGAERMFWGTDITRLPCSWRQAITHITEENDWLTARDKDLIMGRALCDWIGWREPLA